MHLDVLVVAAFAPELAPFRASLGESLDARVGGLSVTARAVGIGLATAGMGALERIGETKPRAVVLVGTCGAYANLQRGDVAIAHRVLLVEPAVAEARAAFPDPMSIEHRADARIAAALVSHGGRASDVATTLAVTTDDALARVVARATACDAEHLEAFAVASACARAGVPFASALGVANDVGSRGRGQWRESHRAASDAAARVVVSWLQAGAPGVER